ncbi:MAG TPA: hypothetical protein VID76_00405 [Solirubrobacterales bacterium]|jgi:hypothetical protein
MEASAQKRGAAPAGLIERVRRAGPGTLLFVAALLIAAAFLLDWLSQLTFWRDEWAFILDRRGSSLDVYLQPFVEQLLAVPLAVYKLLIAAFGIESPLPFQIAHTAAFVATMAVVFVYVRRRVGEWLALAAVLPMLFFGPSWDDILFPFQISLIAALGCGVGALLALDREDRRGDLIAMVLLTIGLFSQHVAIPFVAAAALDIAFTRERWRRAYVIVIPAALWLLWYAGWGREAQNFVSVHNFATEIGYVGDGLASSLSSLVGLAVPRDEMALTPVDWGRPLLVIAIGFGIWRVASAGVGAMPRRLWAVIAAQLSFWTLTGLNAAFFGQATSGRYQLVGAVLWVMIAAELLRGMRIARGVVIAVLAVSALSALANFALLRQTAGGLAEIAEQQRGGLAALELTRDEVASGFTLTEENSGVDYLGIVDAASWFSAIDAYGTPAYTPAELAQAPEVARQAADRVFAAALEIHTAPADPAAAAGAGCARIALDDAPAAIPVGSELILRSVDAEAELALRRYASASFPAELGAIKPGQTLALTIPADGSRQPWQLAASGTGTLVACDPEAAG